MIATEDNLVRTANRLDSLHPLSTNPGTFSTNPVVLMRNADRLMTKACGISINVGSFTAKFGGHPAAVHKHLKFIAC
jgi:hypothetical protein